MLRTSPRNDPSWLEATSKRFSPHLPWGPQNCVGAFFFFGRGEAEEFSWGFLPARLFTGFFYCLSKSHNNAWKKGMDVGHCYTLLFSDFLELFNWLGTFRLSLLQVLSESSPCCATEVTEHLAKSDMRRTLGRGRVWRGIWKMYTKIRLFLGDCLLFPWSVKGMHKPFFELNAFLKSVFNQEKASFWDLHVMTQPDLIAVKCLGLVSFSTAFLPLSI